MLEFNGIPVPSDGVPIQMDDDRCVVSDSPIVLFIEGDGTGRDIWKASRAVFDAAAEKAYGGSRRIAWYEILAGEKARDRLGRLAPLLFQDDDPAAARARRDTPVEPAEVSERAKRKADTKTNPEGFPVHSFPTLLGDLSNLVLNRVSLPTQEKTAITIPTEPTKLQRRAFDLLGVDPQRTVSITVTG